jgi:tRNA nucleotidyltransferase (CCA-adding enzyme)
MEERNLRQLLHESLQVDQMQLLDLVREAATGQGMPLYMVGGAVRDLVMGRRLNDFDLIVVDDAIVLARSLASKHGGGVTAHTRFGTAKWFLPEPFKASHEALDLISARSETYRHPAALPTVQRGSITDDLLRRDFTINAMAIRLDDPHFGELRDDLHGMLDLEQGLIRVLHPGSFMDDPTRMYRAVRYAARYGFRLADEDTLTLIPAALAYVEKLSPQRIRHELDLVLDEPNAISILRQLDELGLLAAVHPSLAGFDRSRFATLHSDDPLLQDRNPRWILWLMHLPAQEIEFVHERLHFSADLLRSIRSAALLNANAAAIRGLKPSEAVEVLEGYSFKALEVVSSAIEDGPIKDTLSAYLSRWRHIKPGTTGHDLKKRGVAPGPRYAEILRRLRAAWLDGEVTSEEGEKKILEEMLGKAG